ncbi:MAG TPA: S9 family peptidase, partial [Microbacterium sp.]|nr:S9 family peptidase [Microbacterium sp.]
MTVRASDIEKLISVGRPTIAPDGSFTVFATSRPDVTANRNVGQLWRVDLPADITDTTDTPGVPVRLTRGVADRQPQISPDGTRVAFLRADADGAAQIFVIPAAGGEPVQATDAQGGVGEFAWSPDSTALAYTARVAEPGRYGTVEKLDASSEAPRRITGIRWHANGLGYLADRPAHVFVVDAPDPFAEPFYEPAAAVRAEGENAPDTTVVAAEPRALTSGATTHRGVVFAADGREVLTIPDEIESDRRDLRSRLIAIATDGSGTRELVPRSWGLSISDVAVAADGAIALLADVLGGEGGEGIDFVAPGTGLWLLDDGALGSGRGARLLTPPETMDLGEVGSHITPLGDDFLVQNRSRGRVELLRVTRDGGIADVQVGDVEVVGHAAAGERIVSSHATESSFGEVSLLVRGRHRTLTDFGAVLRGAGLVRPVELEITG